MNTAVKANSVDNCITEPTANQQVMLDGLVGNVMAFSADPESVGLLGDTIEQICGFVANTAISNPEMYAIGGPTKPTADPGTEWPEFVKQVHSDPEWCRNVDWLASLDEGNLSAYLLDRYQDQSKD